jgi:hypothetical protein
MGTTPNLSLPYPELSDSPDVPRDIKALAEDVDEMISTRRVWFGQGGSVYAVGPIALGTTSLIDPSFISRSGEILTVLKTGLYAMLLQATGQGVNHVLNVNVGGPMLGAQHTCYWIRDGAQYAITNVLPFIAGQQADFSVGYMETGNLTLVYTSMIYMGGYKP